MRKLLLALLLLLLAVPAAAQGGKLIPLVVDDGLARRTYWIDPAHELEFADSAPQGSQVKGGEAPAEVGPGVWLRPAGAAAKSLSAPASPAFRVSSSQDSALMGLPGGVIVVFEGSVTQEQARALLAARGLTITREFALTAPSFEVASEPGMACIDLARELLSDPLIRVASPNWWQQVEAK